MIVDINRLSLASNTLPSKKRGKGSTPTHPENSGKAPHHKMGERFLCGPIPMDWVYVASRASGQGSGFKVAMVLWYLSGLHHKAKTVKLSNKMLREMGVNRHAGYRGLVALESAGLVSVERHAGRCPIVTILEVEEAK